MKRLNLTSKILDKLGFSEYWDEHGTWGTRTLFFSNGLSFQIIEQEEMDDDTEGHYPNGIYVANHYSYLENDLFFLHEMYACILEHLPDCIEEFTLKCRAVKMESYII